MLRLLVLILVYSTTEEVVEEGAVTAAPTEPTPEELLAARAAFDFLEPPTFWKWIDDAWQHSTPGADELAVYEKSRRGGGKAPSSRRRKGAGSSSSSSGECKFELDSSGGSVRTAPSGESA